MARGTLRIYLGAAPGVGKTVAMLDEGRRRLARGTDVVVAFAETHGRAHTASALEGLPCVERKHVRYRDSDFTELDLAAVLQRHPAVALVDELAHTNVPGSGSHERRWQDVDSMLDAGIDVISTLNIQHLESLNDVVREITGVPQRETVPDAVVRAADQIELVDMSPEALRKRMAHGNVYPPERVDAALGNYFRVGNLTALRELALLWLADRVEEGMQRYRDTARHHRDVGDQGAHRRRADRRPRGRHAHPAGVADRGADGRRRAARGARRAQRRAVRAGRRGARRAAAARRVPRRQLPLGGRRLGARGPARLRAARRRDPDRARRLAAQPAGRCAERARDGRDGHAAVRPRSTSTSSPTSRRVAGGRGCPRLTRGLTTRRRLLGLLLAAVLLPVLTLVCTAAPWHVGFRRRPAALPARRGADQPGRRLLPGAGQRRGRQPAAELLLRRAAAHVHHQRAVEPRRGGDLPAHRGAGLAGRRPRRATLGAGRAGRGRGRDAVDLRRQPAARRAGAARAARPHTGDFAMDAASLLRHDPADAAVDRGGHAGERPAGRRRPRPTPTVAGRRRPAPGAARAPAQRRRPAGARRLRGQRRRRVPPARARRGGPRGRAARRVRSAADRAAQRRQPRPAHADRGGQGGGVEPARGRGALGRGRSPRAARPPPRTRWTGSPTWSPTCSTSRGCRSVRCRSCTSVVGVDDVVARALDHVPDDAVRRRRADRPARGAGRRRPARTGHGQRGAERAAARAGRPRRCASPAARTPGASRCG